MMDREVSEMMKDVRENSGIFRQEFDDHLEKFIEKFCKEKNETNEHINRLLVGTCTLGGMQFLSKMFIGFALMSDNPDEIFYGFMDHFSMMARKFYQDAKEEVKNETKTKEH